MLKTGMLKTIVAAAVGLLFGTTSGWAQCTVPNTLTNGTNADATQVMANFTALLTCINTAPSGGGLPTAQGRLTLATGTPVMTSAQTSKTVIYYTPYVGNQLLITTNGTSFTAMAFTELSNVTTNSSVGNAGPAAVAANSNYDLFVWSSSGTLVLTRGPAWTNDTTRSLSISRIAGIWTNGSAITNGPGANLGTYVGTVRSDGSSQINWNPLPAPAGGGGNAVLGVFNAYNRLPVVGQSIDSTTSWLYTSTTWRAADGSNNNRISYIDGLAEIHFSAAYNVYCQGTSGVATAVIGINRDSTSATPTPIAASAIMGSNGAIPNNVQGAFLPSLGFHYVQAMERGGDGTLQTTFYGVTTYFNAALFM